MNVEYISREAIIEDLEKEIEAGDVALNEDVWINKGLRIAIRDIKDLKAADVNPAKRGKWDGYICSECNVCADYFVSGDFYFDEKPNFCPNCGADMRGDSK